MSDILLSEKTYPDIHISPPLRVYLLSCVEENIELFLEQPDAVMCIIHDCLEPTARIYFETSADDDAFYRRMKGLLYARSID